MSILRRRPGAEHPRRVRPPARLHGKASAGSVSSAPRRCRGLLALLTLVQHHRRQTDLRHGGRGAPRRWQTAARPDHKSKAPERRDTTRDETSRRQLGGHEHLDRSRHHLAALSTSTARPCQQREHRPARARAPDRPAANGFPGSWRGNSGCGSHRIPQGHQPAPAHGSCTGLELSRGLNPPPRPLRRRDAGIGPSQAGQRSLGSARPAAGHTAGRDGPDSPSPPRSRPSPRQEPRGTSAEPTVHSTGRIIQR